MTREILIKTSKCEDFLIEEMKNTKRFRCFIGAHGSEILSAKFMIDAIFDKLSRRDFSMIDGRIANKGDVVFDTFRTDKLNVIFERADVTHLVFFGLEDLTINEICAPVIKSKSLEKIIIIEKYGYGAHFVNYLINNFKFNGHV